MGDAFFWIIGIAIVSIFLIYHPKSPLEVGTQQSIQSWVPKAINDGFINRFNPEKQTLIDSGQLTKLGKPQTDCSTDKQCQDAFNNYQNVICGNDGSCYYGV